VAFFVSNTKLNNLLNSILRFKALVPNFHYIKKLIAQPYLYLLSRSCGLSFELSTGGNIILVKLGSVSLFLAPKTF